MNYCNLAQLFLLTLSKKFDSTITIREVDFLNFEFEYLSKNEFCAKPFSPVLGDIFR